MCKIYCHVSSKGPSINYVVSVGGRPKDDLLHRPYLIKKDDKGGGGQKLSILRRHSLWTAPNGTVHKRRRQFEGHRGQKLLKFADGQK